MVLYLFIIFYLFIYLDGWYIQFIFYVLLFEIVLAFCFFIIFVGWWLLDFLGCFFWKRGRLDILFRF